MSENKLDNSEDNIPNLSEELSNIANNDDNNNKKQKKRSKLRIILYIIGAVSAFGVIGFVSIIVYVYILSLQLPSTDEFSKFKYTEPMVVYDAKGNIIAELGAERRYPISIEQMPPYVYQSVVAVEDARFYEHSGIDPLGIARAMVSNIKAGKMVEGGSTLTQQLVKVIYLSPERKVKRKIKEAIIAYRLDKELSKDKILELYLNQVNFGRGAYGIQAAAINYFGKEDVKDLTIAEAAMIAGIPKGPSIYAPHLNMKRAVARRNHVLKRMLEVKYITQEEYNAAVNETVKLSESIPLRLRHAGYFMDFVHKYIEEDLKIEDAQNKGIKVFTTLNLDYQIAAEDALIKNLMSIAKREGYKGTLGKILIEDDTDVEQIEDIIDNAVVSEENDNNTVKYVRLDNDVPSYLKDLGYQKAVITEAEKNTLKIKLSDGSEGTINFKDNNWITNAKNARAKSFLDVFAIDDMIYVSPVLKDNISTGVYMIEQNPDLEGAVVSINPQTGEIYAMAGGMSYFKSFFNRAVQARRQVGSTFKPLVYAAAYESGYYPMSVFYDTPVIQKSVKQGEEDWRPKNFDGQFMGEMTLERALQLSNNSITIKLAQAIGIKKIIRYAQMFGFTGEIPADLSVSIGSLSASPLELAVAYSTFSNQGMRPSKPFFVTRVADIDNKTLFEFQKPEMTRVLDEKSASLITDSLVKVVEKGGAWKSRNAVNRILGGKTGTSNDSKDGWFAGVLPNFVTVAWVGYDDYRKMGSYAVGGNTAQNIFIDYFKSINEKVPLALFKAPAGASYFKVNNDMHEITDSLIGNLGYSIYPVDSSNNPTVYDFKKVVLMYNENIENINKFNLQKTAEEQQHAKYKSRSIANSSAKMKRIYDLVEVVAPIDVSIHITGEDGCGKDKLAEYIHSQSGRTGNFIIINPVELNDIVGSLGFSKVYDYFKKAEKGTLYISDIASANAKLQEYLLNSIIKIEQELGMFSPRFISSTNRNLTELSRQQRFNQRLRDSFAIIINIPPLRERKEDIVDLIRIIMRDLGYFGQKSIPISEEAEEMLQSYDWPGNVRQLVNTIYHAVNHTSSGMIVLSSLPKDVRKKQGFVEAEINTINELYKFARGLIESGIHSEAINPYEEYCKTIERPLIQAALDMTKGNRSQAAQLIRINRNTLHKKIQTYDMEE